MLSLGRTFATPGALELLARSGASPGDLLARHASGDWGDLDEHDKAVNAAALESSGRVLSSYMITPNDKVWVITEWDRSATTILLPSEY